jgi:DNA-binding MarR family transcriptional regulator
VKDPKRDASLRSGRFAYEGLERIFHERARLGILTSLLSHDAGLVFNDLKALVNLTDGNLSRQIQALEEAGLVEVWKGQKNNRPLTLCRLTDFGRERFLEYLEELQRVIADAEKLNQPQRASRRGRLAIE